MNSKIISFFLNNNYVYYYILFPLLLLFSLNCVLKHRYIKKNSNLNSEAPHQDTINLYTIFVILMTLLFLRNIPFIKYVIDSIVYSFLIYILIIVPLFNKKIFYDFVDDNTIISLFLFMELYNIISKAKFLYISSISNQILIQVLIILIIFSIIFLVIYIFLINAKFILFYLSILVFKPMVDNLYKLTTLLNKKYNKSMINEIIDFEKLKIESLIILTWNLILFTFFIIVIRSLLIAILYLFGTFKNFFEKNDNSCLHIISKIAIISTIFSLYLILQISGTFDSAVISSYEFIASTIIIPLLLEGLLTKNNEI